MAKKRILIFSTAYFPLVGGAEIAVREITRRIPGVDFVLVTARLQSDLAPHERIDNVDVYRIGKGDSFDKIRLIFAGVKKARELGTFDLVWSIMASYAGFAALRYKKQTGTKFLLTLQEGDSEAHIYSRAWLVWPWFKQIFKKADRIQAISNYLAEWGKKMGATCPIEVIPNGFEEEDFSFRVEDFGLEAGDLPSNPSSLELTEENKKKIEIINRVENLQPNDVLVITVSRLVKKNGIEFLIRAMKYLPGNYKLRIVGDGPLMRTLKNLVNNLELSSRVFFHGEIEHKNIWKYFHPMRYNQVFVRPSLSEGLGNAFLEAMFLCTLVIATPVGGIPDFLKDGETGWFCKVKDPKSIAEKISYVIKLKNEEKNKVILNAYRFALVNYSWKMISTKMGILIGSMV